MPPPKMISELSSQPYRLERPGDRAPSPGWRRAREVPAATSDAPFRALLVFTVVLMLAPQRFLPALTPLRPAFLAAAVAAGACLVDRLRRGLPLDLGLREVRLAGALALWALATIPLSYWPGGSLELFLDVFVKSLVVFWILCGTIDDARRLRRLLWTLSLLTLPVAATAIANFVDGTFAPGAGPDGSRRIAGYAAPLTGNPNDLALLLNLLLPLVATLAASTRRPAQRAVLLGIAFLDVAAVVSTFSRGGFVTLLATSLALVLRSARLRRLSVLLAPLLIVAALSAPLVLPSGYVANLGTITDIRADSTGSAQERWRDMTAATEFFVAHPIVGAGIGMNSLALNEVRGFTWRMVHNAYLECAVDLGLPGLALFAALVWGCLRRARDARRRALECRLPAELATWAAGIEASVVGFAVAACFHPVTYHFYFYFVGALAVATSAVVTRLAGEGARA